MADDDSKTPDADEFVRVLADAIKSLVKPVQKAAGMQVVTCGGPECGRMHFIMLDDKGNAVIEASATPEELEVAIASFREYLANRGTTGVTMPFDRTIN